MGIEQFDIPHELGSHAGQSRIIRKAYYEHPNYVPLLESAYENWQRLEEACGYQLYFKSGLLYFGPENHPLIAGTLESASKHGIDINQFSRNEQIDQYPQFKIPKDYTNLFEVDAGFITPERAILAFIEQALKHGAEINIEEKVLDWSKKDGIFQVNTNRRTYRCKKLVLAAGPWLSGMIPHYKLKVTRQVIAWAKPKKPHKFDLHNFPCWAFAEPSVNGMFYGFPSLPADVFGGPEGIKMGHHSEGEMTDPDMVNRKVTKGEERNLINAVTKFLPHGIESINTMKTCLYTYSPDEHFMLDFYDENKDIVVAAGFSGHGFKFASVVGEILCDLITEGKTKHPIDFLSTRRFNSVQHTNL